MTWRPATTWSAPMAELRRPPAIRQASIRLASSVLRPVRLFRPQGRDSSARAVPPLAAHGIRVVAHDLEAGHDLVGANGGAGQIAAIRQASIRHASTDLRPVQI